MCLWVCAEVQILRCCWAAHVIMCGRASADNSLLVIWCAVNETTWRTTTTIVAGHNDNTQLKTLGWHYRFINITHSPSMWSHTSGRWWFLKLGNCSQHIIQSYTLRCSLFTSQLIILRLILKFRLNLNQLFPPTFSGVCRSAGLQILLRLCNSYQHQLHIDWKPTRSSQEWTYSW